MFALALTLGLSFGIQDAQAKRLGGGKSVGMQRQVEAPKAPAAPAAAPAPSAPTAAMPAKPASAAPQATPARSWLGPVAGLAAGLGLAALASHFGFGEELASFMLMALIAFAVLAVVGFFLRKRALAQQPALAGNAGGHFRSGDDEPVASRFEAMRPTVGAGMTAPAATGRVPADFDVAGFVRSAKVNYIRLQAANDAGNLDDLRAFTTPEMFAELKMDLAERGSAKQETDVIDLDAEVLEVVEEGNRYIASVRFTGHIREEKHGPVESVDEIWHLVKPRDGSGGWLLAGMQQVS
ncbi:MAG: Tim44-like domain-containing protein [Rhodocyclaceae bacterium]|nr:Tim44-like domain-containing protein [Rhodocyclaceae bacterium]